MKTFAVLLCLVVAVRCGPVNADESVMRTIIENFANCNSDLGLCLKEHALKAADRFSAARNIKIVDGITLLNSNPRESRNLESLSSDPTVRNKQVTERLWRSTSDILQSTDLELSYGGSDDDESTTNITNEEVEEGRGKKKKEIKKKLKVLIPLILLAKAKAVYLAVISLVVMAASLFKLALIAKVAFIIKLISILKELLAKKRAQEEIVWQPQGWDPHAEHHPAPVEHGHGWEGGWSRSKIEANNLAYSGYGI